ncbi:MAG: universal stress protein [Polyangiaceae bacterium]
MPERENEPLVVLVAIDFEPQSTHALVAAAALARRASATVVHAIHVVDLIRQADIGGLALADYHRRAREQLDLLIAHEKLEGVVIPHVHLGAPADVLVHAAESMRADVLVLGTHGRQGIERLVFGSVAELVVRRATCSVVVVRPKQDERAAGIEPPCPACVTTATESGGAEIWCTHHRIHHPRAHIYGDDSSTVGGMGSNGFGAPG